MNFGRFPNPQHLPVYTTHRRYDLSESTSPDLTLGDIIDLVGIDAVRNFSLDYGYEQEGLSAFRQAISERCGVPIEGVLTTLGAAFALYLISAELTNAPHKTAIITTPYFQQSHDTLAANGWRIKTVQNDFDKGYALDVDGIASLLDETIQLVSIASPQNPSGVSVPLDTIGELLAVMAQKAPQAYLLVDETYREAAFSAENILPSAAGAFPFDRLLTCSSVSKAYGAPGLRTGWLTTRDANLMARLLNATKNIVICHPRLNEQLAAILMHNADAVLEKQRSFLNPALALVAAWQHSEQHRVDWNRPNAGALCCMCLGPQFSDAQLPRFWQALADNETIVRPGLLFGSDIRHFRLGFGHLSLHDLEIGLSNLSAALDAI